MVQSGGNLPSGTQTKGPCVDWQYFQASGSSKLGCTLSHIPDGSPLQPQGRCSLSHPNWESEHRGKHTLNLWPGEGILILTPISRSGCRGDKHPCHGTWNPCWPPGTAPSSMTPPLCNLGPHLLHRGIAAGKLLAEVCDVVVTLLHVLLEVLTEVHQGLLHLAVQLLVGETHSGPGGHQL